MFTVKDFVEKFEKQTDAELYHAHSIIDDYSDEGSEALKIVINQRGGIEKLTENLVAEQKIQQEILRIKKETSHLARQGVDAEFLKTYSTKSILPDDQVKQIIEDHHETVTAQIEDEKVTPDTIGRTFIATGIASLVGGILFGLTIIFSARIFYLFVVGLVLISFAIVRGVTKKSMNNIAVVVATVVSVALSVFIGMLLYQLIGYIK